ncbi:hypothetical protein [Chryseosolibacter indicus]|uniref:Lipoprotein n=1 Tax=Chryseosolibacter indicus TaxID=2782351 RepID=A0ABS5VYM6_9BACT|nr:hypothetical protein [Chryseosolibacter indicus]MBT1705952.1 hypothetical protein [Chryseosolibacter indicus]
MKVKFTNPRFLKFLFPSILSALVFMSVISCSDDDDSNTPANKFTIGDTTVVIKRAIFNQDPTEGTDGFYNHTVGFASEGYEIKDGEHIEGKGSVASFSFYSKSETLAPGTYTYTGEEEVRTEGNVWSAGVDRGVTKVVFEGDVYSFGGKEYDFSSGKIEISKSGDTYTIVFTGKAFEENAANPTQVDFSCNYKGKLELIVQK